MKINLFIMANGHFKIYLRNSKFNQKVMRVNTVIMKANFSTANTMDMEHTYRLMVKNTQDNLEIIIKKDKA